MPNGKGGQGKGFVDYVLWGDDGKPLAPVEAKRSRRSAKDGEQQAKLYADCLESNSASARCSTQQQWLRALAGGTTASPPRAVQGFHTRDELALLVQRRSTRLPLAGFPINPAIAGRHYHQQRAIRRIAETFEAQHQRRALVVMATYAGKTRTVVALVDVLMRAHWCKRVLFLADRVALVTQAVNAFKAHLPDRAIWPDLVTDRDTDGRVYVVCTYPTMMV